MPFIEQWERDELDDIGIDTNTHTILAMTHGRRCYVFYRDMVKKWKARPCWTTAHEIYKEMVVKTMNMMDDASIAYQLAWQVFFIKYVMKYEDIKEIENGTI